MVETEFARHERNEIRTPEDGDNIIDLSRSGIFRQRRPDAVPQPLADPILLDRDPVLDIAKELHKALREFLKDQRGRSQMQAGFLVPRLQAASTGGLLKLLDRAVLKLEGIFENNSHASISMVETANKARAIKGAVAEFYSVLDEFSPEGKLRNTTTGLVVAAALSLQGDLAEFIETLNRMAVQKYYNRATLEDPSGTES